MAEFGFQPLRAGELNRKVSIEREVALDNQRGGRTKSWQLVSTVWAKMVPLRGSEVVALNIQRTTELWRVTIRFRSDVTTKMRLRQGEKTFNIRSAVDPFGRRDRIVMDCETGVPS